MTRILLGLDKIPRPDDAADALAPCRLPRAQRGLAAHSKQIVGEIYVLFIDRKACSSQPQPSRYKLRRRGI